MKKILLLLNLTLLCACSAKSDGSDTRISSKGRTPAVYIEEFKYKKHSYVMFRLERGSAVVHDPECKYCYEKFD